MPNTEADTGRKVVHVAVGVLQNSAGEILIARRHAQQHQGGLWEFPGGKVEPEETVIEALAREFLEEVCLTIGPASPLLKIEHDYGDKKVLLDVWHIREFSGEAHGSEGQPLCWVPLDRITEYAFPAANVSIVEHLLKLGSRMPGTE